MIPANPQYDRSIKVSEKRLRVAAYCRVSTELIQQESSYVAQVEYYTNKIEEIPNWRNAGIYADDGKSATDTKKRNDFNAMIKDAQAGKIDLILTKSVSRFARNTVDALTTIRKLKEKNVAVIFEKEGINTLESTGEILLTILSSLAQEESRNISENIRWGIVRRFEKGKVIVNHNKFMGYTKDENGELIIVPEEAEIVKLVFQLYLEGYSGQKIGKHLESLGIRTVTGKSKWQGTVIMKMLQNEKYIGDALLQKTYTIDFMTKKRVINNGIVPRYYIENDHEAIIPKEVFYQVQAEIARRSSLRKTGSNKSLIGRHTKYVLTGILVCRECGQEYRRVTRVRNGEKTIVWRCKSRLEKNLESCKTSETVEEKVLHRIIMEAIRQMAGYKENYEEIYQKNIAQIIGNCGRGEEAIVFMGRSASQLKEFDNYLVRELIEKVEIITSERFLIQFKSGFKMEQLIK